MISPEQSQSVVELIQVALTPVFLIMGIGTMLSVVTGRVARVIDRIRWYEDRFDEKQKTYPDRIMREIQSLDRRLSLANWAINFLTGAAVIVCIDIIVLLLSGIVDTNLNTLLLILFVTSISFITFGLVAFFLEVSIATATLKLPNTLRK